MTTKQPTAQGISRLLAAAGFERSQRSSSRIRGYPRYSEGYKVESYVDRVVVRHTTGTFLDTSQRERDMLAQYAEAIRAKGWKATGPAEGGPLELTVTAADQTADEG
jgi:hypothetical protein